MCNSQTPAAAAAAAAAAPHLHGSLHLSAHCSGAHLGAVTAVHRHWQRLSCQCRLVNLQAAIVDEAVSRHGRAGAQQHHVTGHQELGIDVLPGAVALDGSGGFERGLERGHCVSCLDGLIPDGIRSSSSSGGRWVE
jgi:hypothetical protein